MSGIRMSLVAGSGRAARHGDLVAFSAAPIGGFDDLLVSDGTDVFKRLAALVVRHQFALPAFAVIDTAARRAFVFGDLSLDGPGGSISGRQATTWVEATVGELELLTCSPDDTPPDPDTDLVAGTVPAGGFALSFAPSADPPAAPVRPSDTAAPAAAAPSRPPESTAKPEPPGFREPDPAPGGATDRSTGVEEVPARLSILDQPADWNPLADPVGVDLASLGRVNHQPASDPPIGVGHGSTAGPVPRPPAASAPPAPPDPVTIALRPSLGVPAGPEAGIPPPPDGPVPAAPTPPPVPPAPAGPADDDPGATLPEIPSPTATADLAEGPSAPARLRCDDGQLIEVRVGAYVGRHPTKGGLPDGYVAVTVRGEHVSRVHWQLTVTGDGLLIADLGSASGTSIQLPGWTQPATLEGTEQTVVVPGTTVHFADRWAVVEA